MAQQNDDISHDDTSTHPISSDTLEKIDNALSILKEPGGLPELALPPTHKRQLIPRSNLRLVAAAVGVLVILAGLAGGYALFHSGRQPSPSASATFQTTACPFKVGAGLVEGQNVKCGFLVVPEDRSQPGSRSIRLAVAIFKTPNPHPAPDPLLVLGGGPGVPQLAGASSVNMSNLASFAPDRDVILLDQRGVGYSQPSLNCQNNEPLLACHDRLVKEGINLNAYTTLGNAADVHDLVRTLGYKRINLEGISYGTRLALTVMRLFPADLRSVVLKSVFPPQVNSYATMAAYVQHAFDMLFQGCAANPHCNAVYPHLQAIFYSLVTNLNKQPITFQATDPQTGERTSVEFSGDKLSFWLYNALEDTNLIPLLPAVIFQISHQNYKRLSQLYESVGFPISLGLFYSIQCGEDMAYTTLQALTDSVQIPAPELQSGIFDSLQEQFVRCQMWGVKAVPSIQKKPVRSSIPTLIMEGDYDPNTPPADGMLAAQTLSRSFFFLFPGVSHGVHTTNPCPDDIEQAFLDNPTERPDGSCISSMHEPAFI